MPSKVIQNRTFDARPDRIDYRDRIYNPPLVNLPDQFPAPGQIADYLTDYTDGCELILDQGNEGACTGFGLAATINYLLWRKRLATDDDGHATKVSPRMLYQMARIYDEWPGEDYEGSSCRGAMKGWHRHGVCTDQLWVYRDDRFVTPHRGWQQDAARRPLGAYYRIDKDSIADMQAAIFEVGAIYVSADVHDGWFIDSTPQLPVIPLQAGVTGGHAFALIGYDSRGFIVQNSWGRDWGFLGFAVLSYADWIQHGVDAWVAVLGAPMAVHGNNRAFSSQSLQRLATGQGDWDCHPKQAKAAFTYAKSKVQPLSEDEAYTHSIVLGNDGRPLNRLLDVADAAAAIKEIAYDLPLQWLQSQRKPRLAIYAHGGLNNEEASIKRARVMAPYFRENGIYPLFITWKTGFGESIGGILDDAADKYLGRAEGGPARSLFDDIKHQLSDAWDRSIEAACENLLVKPVWMQMKQNAAAGTRTGAGLNLLARHIAALTKACPDLQTHLVGHSAGSIIHGHLLDLLVRRKLTIAGVHLYAPACTVRFALDHYHAAVNKGYLAKQQMFFDILSNERERADTVGPYRKSLLYLVSRALESVHKMPLLGMEASWFEQAEDSDMWNRDHAKDLATWRQVMPDPSCVRVHTRARAKVSDGQDLIALGHGSFDNDIEVVSHTLERIRGGRLTVKVENLKGF